MKENAERARALDTNEIQKELRESAEQMFRLRFQLRMGQMEGLKKMRSLRKERARMLTVLRERELHPESAAPKPASKPAPKREKPEPKPAAPKKSAAKPAAAKKTAAKKAPAAKKAAAPKQTAAKKTAVKTKKPASKG